MAMYKRDIETGGLPRTRTLQTYFKLSALKRQVDVSTSDLCVIEGQHCVCKRILLSGLVYSENRVSTSNLSRICDIVKKNKYSFSDLRFNTFCIYSFKKVDQISLSIL